MEVSAGFISSVPEVVGHALLSSGKVRTSLPVSPELSRGGAARRSRDHRAGMPLASLLLRRRREAMAIRTAPFRGGRAAAG